MVSVEFHGIQMDFMEYQWAWDLLECKDIYGIEVGYLDFIQYCHDLKIARCCSSEGLEFPSVRVKAVFCSGCAKKAGLKRHTLGRQYSSPTRRLPSVICEASRTHYDTLVLFGYDMPLFILILFHP